MTWLVAAATTCPMISGRTGAEDLGLLCVRVCFERWSERINLFEHWVQTNFFSPVCVRRWRCNSSDRVNLLVHMFQSQTNGLFPSCPRRWALRCEVLPYVFEQMWQICWRWRSPALKAFFSKEWEGIDTYGRFWLVVQFGQLQAILLVCFLLDDDGFMLFTKSRTVLGCEFELFWAGVVAGWLEAEESFVMIHFWGSFGSCWKCKFPKRRTDIRIDKRNLPNVIRCWDFAFPRAVCWTGAGCCIWGCGGERINWIKFCCWTFG